MLLSLKRIICNYKNSSERLEGYRAYRNILTVNEELKRIIDNVQGYLKNWADAARTVIEQSPDSSFGIDAKTMGLDGGWGSIRSATGMRGSRFFFTADDGMLRRY